MEQMQMTKKKVNEMAIKHQSASYPLNDNQMLPDSLRTAKTKKMQAVVEMIITSPMRKTPKCQQVKTPVMTIQTE